MIDLLVQNPLLLLFVVAAIGYPLGRVKIGGTSLGVAAVLFVGLGMGALHPDLKLPEIFYNLGLVLFVYTIGLSSGATFISSLRKQGLRDNLLCLGTILFGFGLVIAARRVFSLPATLAAGLFSGSLTNTPSLAGLLEFIQNSAGPGLVEQLRAEPVVAYSLTYPMGVIGMILAASLLQRLWKIDFAAEATGLGLQTDPLTNRTMLVTNSNLAGQPVQDLIQRFHWNVIFGRYRRSDEAESRGLVNGQTRFQVGDQVSIIGRPDEIEKVVRGLGVDALEHLEQDLSTFDKRRLFVSNPQVAGKRLRDLDLLDRFGAIVTRVRRGDSEILPHGETRLALGDQVRVVARYEQMEPLANLFGDSYRAVSEVDILTFSLGLAIGLLLGLAPIPLPNGVTLRLGLAGGPLLVALVLGALGRTGPMVWALPFSANLTLRQIGLVLFLAGVGTRAGYAFFTTLTQGDGLLLFAAGAAITTLAAFGMLVIGYKVLKIPFGYLLGLLAGMQTQTALLGYALEQTHNELPNLGYTSVYPVATLSKIILAQVILVMFW